MVLPNIQSNEVNQVPSKKLPTEIGFYWWRQDAAFDWRMIEAKNFGDDGIAHLSFTDVELQSFGGRSYKSWEEYFVIGEWMQIVRPPHTLASKTIQQTDKGGGYDQIQGMRAPDESDLFGGQTDCVAAPKNESNDRKLRQES